MNSFDMLIKYSEFSAGFNVLMFGGAGWVMGKELERFGKISWVHSFIILSFIANAFSVYNLISIFEFAYIELEKKPEEQNAISDLVQSSVSCATYSLVVSFVSLTAYIIIIGYIRSKSKGN